MKSFGAGNLPRQQCRIIVPKLRQEVSEELCRAITFYCNINAK